MSILEFRDTLAVALNNIDDVRCGPYGYLQGNISAPQAVLDYEVTGPIVFAHGAYGYTLHVYLYHKRASERSAQEFFDRHRDPHDDTSLWRIIEDTDYGTSADYARCTNASAIQAVDYAGSDLLMVDFTVEAVL